MAWTITDWTGNPDWSALANVNDFIGAVRERQLALVQSQDSLKNVGDDVQAASLWSGLQQWIEDNYTAFVVSHDAGVKRATTYYDDKDHSTYGPGFPDPLSFLFGCAGLSTVDWRRYTTHPDDAGSDLGGQMQAGDIIGPWVFEDLQKVLNVLIWTLSHCQYIYGAAGGQKFGEGGDDYTEDWEVAKSNAEADWSDWGPGPYLFPIAATAGHNDWGWWGRDYTAQGRRRKMKLKLSSAIGTGISRDIDWHVYSIAASYPAIGWSFQTETFDANGEVDVYSNALAQDTWQRWRTESPAADVAKPEPTDYLASNLNFPNWCDEPGDDQAEARGFQISGCWTCVRWDVSGGFQHV